MSIQDKIKYKSVIEIITFLMLQYRRNDITKSDLIKLVIKELEEKL